MIRLRPYKSMDASYLLNWLEDERRFAMWCAGKFTYPLTLEQLEAYRKETEHEENKWIFTALNEAGRPVGHFSCGLRIIRSRMSILDLLLSIPTAAGKGLEKKWFSLQSGMRLKF